LYAISHDAWQIVREALLYHDSISINLTAQQAQHFSDYVVQIQRNSLRLGLLEEGADTSHYFCSVFAIADNPFRCFACADQIGRLGREPAKAGVSVQDNGCQGLIDFMGNRGREFSNSRSLGGSRKPVLNDSQRFLYALAISDIDE
jgi:hypothetical protein